MKCPLNLVFYPKRVELVYFLLIIPNFVKQLNDDNKENSFDNY